MVAVHYLKLVLTNEVKNSYRKTICRMHRNVY